MPRADFYLITTPRFREQPLRLVCELARKAHAAGLPTLILTRDAAQAETILATGQAHAVSIGRAALRDPHWAASAASSWARSFRGDQRSSSSRKLTQRPRAAPMPAFRATETPCETS